MQAGDIWPQEQGSTARLGDTDHSPRIWPSPGPASVVVYKPAHSLSAYISQSWVSHSGNFRFSSDPGVRQGSPTGQAAANTG